MFLAKTLAGRCPDQACGKMLTKNDLNIGFCSVCDGLLPSGLIAAHREEKIEDPEQLVQNRS